MGLLIVRLKKEKKRNSVSELITELALISREQPFVSIIVN